MVANAEMIYRLHGDLDGWDPTILLSLAAARLPRLLWMDRKVR